MDQMEVEDIACMMLQNCFTDPALKAKLGAVKRPTLDIFNDIIESHEAGKRAVNVSAAANTVKRRNDKGKASCPSSNNNKKRIKFHMQNIKGDRKSLENAFAAGNPII